MMNLSNTKQQAKTVKGPREKELTSGDMALRLTDDSQQQQWNTVEVFEENSCQLGILSPSRQYLKNKGKIKTVSDK